MIKKTTEENSSCQTQIVREREREIGGGRGEFVEECDKRLSQGQHDMD